MNADWSVVRSSLSDIAEYFRANFGEGVSIKEEGWYLLEGDALLVVREGKTFVGYVWNSDPRKDLEKIMALPVFVLRLPTTSGRVS